MRALRKDKHAERGGYLSHLRDARAGGVWLGQYFVATVRVVLDPVPPDAGRHPQAADQDDGGVALAGGTGRGYRVSLSTGEGLPNASTTQFDVHRCYLRAVSIMATSMVLG